MQITYHIAGYFPKVQIFPDFPNGLTTQENLFWAADCKKVRLWDWDPFYTATANGSWILCHKQHASVQTHEWKILYQQHSSCVSTYKSISCEIFSLVLWLWISKSGKFLLKLKVYQSGKFAPWENNLLYGTYAYTYVIKISDYTEVCIMSL